MTPVGDRDQFPTWTRQRQLDGRGCPESTIVLDSGRRGHRSRRRVCCRARSSPSDCSTGRPDPSDNPASQRSTARRTTRRDAKCGTSWLDRPTARVTRPTRRFTRSPRVDRQMVPTRPPSGTHATRRRTPTDGLSQSPGSGQRGTPISAQGRVGGGGRESASRRVPPACGIRGGPNESVESNPESNGMS